MSKKNKSKTAQIPIYTESDYKNDQEKFEKSMKTGKLDLSNFQRLMIRDICTNTSIIETGCIGDIKMNDIDKRVVSFISENYKSAYHKQAAGKDENEKLYLRLLLVTDYICGMTDSYAKRLYQELNAVI